METEEALDEIDREVRELYDLSADEQLYFLEIERGDASEFEDTLRVTGRKIGQALGSARHESRGRQRHRGAVDSPGEDDGQASARVLQMDGGEPDRQPVAFPDSR